MKSPFADDQSYIEERFPSFKIEKGFAEEDELWKPDIRETDEHMQIRGQRALDRLFGSGPDHADETCKWLRFLRCMVRSPLNLQIYRSRLTLATCETSSRCWATNLTHSRRGR